MMKMSTSSTGLRFSDGYNQVTSSIPYIALTVSLGLMADTAAYGILVPVLAFRLESVGYTNVPATSSYLIAAFAFGLAVSSIPIGIVGEVVKSRKLPLLLSLGFLAASLIMFWLSSSFPVLVIARILQGFSCSAIWTLGLSLISDVVPETRVGSIMGYVMIGWSVGTVGGPLAGGLLYDSLGYDSIFIFALVITGIDFILRALVQEKRCIRTSPVIAEIAGQATEKETDTSAPIFQYADTPRVPSSSRAIFSLLKNSRCWTLCGITFVFAFAFSGLLDTGMTMLVKNRYGLSSRGAALIFIAAVAPSFISSPLAGHFADKYGAKWPIIISLILGTPFFGLLSINGNLAALIASVTLTGVLLMGLSAPITQDLAEVVKATPGLGFAHVYCIFNLSYSIGALVGPLCIGGLLGRIGISHGWRIGCLIVTCLFASCIPAAWLFLGDKKSTTLLQPSVPPCEPHLKPEVRRISN